MTVRDFLSVYLFSDPLVWIHPTDDRNTFQGTKGAAMEQFGNEKIATWYADTVPEMEGFSQTEITIII